MRLTHQTYSESFKNYAAMLVMPTYMQDHVGHTCPYGLWGAAATLMLARTLKVPLDAIRVMTSHEATNYLDSFAGNTVVLGLRVLEQPQGVSKQTTSLERHHGMVVSSYDTITKSVMQEGMEKTLFDIPNIVRDIIEEELPLFTLLIEPEVDFDNITLSKVDIAASKKRDVIVIDHPIQKVGMWFPKP